jgi:hypothetical protein
LEKGKKEGDTQATSTDAFVEEHQITSHCNLFVFKLKTARIKRAFNSV